jgi:predicted O-methyltransferase YrrM
MSRFGGSCRRKNLAARAHTFPEHSELPPRVIRLDPWEAEYLFLVASLARRGIVEIGRFRGGSTFLLACAAPELPIWSIDVAPVADEEVQRWFARFGVGGNVHLLVGDSQRGSFPEVGELDLLFVDGDHSYEGCRADLDNFYTRLAPGGHVLLHDCRGGRPVQRAVLDFVDETDVEIVRSPYIPASHWLTDYGSIAHLRKPLRSS